MRGGPVTMTCCPPSLVVGAYPLYDPPSSRIPPIYPVILSVYPYNGACVAKKFLGKKCPFSNPLLLTRRFLSYICFMNYFRILNKENETIGVGGVEPGSENEMNIINHLMDVGCTIIKISKEEYDEYNEGDEIVLSET